MMGVAMSTLHIMHRHFSSTSRASTALSTGRLSCTFVGFRGRAHTSNALNPTPQVGFSSSSFIERPLKVSGFAPTFKISFTSATLLLIY